MSSRKSPHKIIAAEIPREFERKKDWGKTKAVTTGLHSNGNFFKFDIHRETSDVNHGVWKQYKLTLIDPDKNLDVQIENLRTLDSGRIALTLNIAAKVHGWAQTVVYDRGIHVIGLEAEGDTGVRLSLDADIGVNSVKSEFVPCRGYAIDPTVTDARIEFDDFQAHTNQRPARHARPRDRRHPARCRRGGTQRPEADGKINESINKHRDRLQLTPEMLLGKFAAKEESCKTAVRP